MKATLLIKNIENLYTCSEDDTILKNAFVAMHHDRIIDMGVHDPKEWIDDATRVIDARGECVVPAFIDCHFNTPDDRLDGDRMRKESDALYLMRMNGILTLISRDPQMRRRELFQEVVISRHIPKIPIIQGVPQEPVEPPILLSCAMNSLPHKMYSMQLLAFFLHVYCGIGAYCLLKAMTCNPAREYGLKELGEIRIGFQGDLLVINKPTIEAYFSEVGVQTIHRMIKAGIQFFPYIMRS